MRKLTFLLALAMIIVFAVPSNIQGSSNQDSIHIEIDGEKVVSDVDPVLSSSRVLVPIRVVSESLGYYVKWEASTREVFINKANTNLKFNLNEAKIWRNGVEKSIDVVPQVQNGRTFLPLRALSENMGAYVEWQGKTRTVYIKNKSVDLSLSDFFSISIEALKKIITLEKNIVMVIARNRENEIVSTGSGFFIDRGLIVTNYHVIEQGAEFEYINNSESTFEIEGIVKYDKDLDLAILKTTNLTGNEGLKLSSITKVKKGDSVVAIGSPQGLLNTVSNGIVSGIRLANEVEDLEGRQLIQMTAPITNGSSGGPLINSEGYVIGVTSYGFDKGTLNFAIAIDHLNSWLNELTSTSFNHLQLQHLPTTTSEYEAANEVDYDLELKKTILLEQLPSEIEQHPTKPILYMNDHYSNQLIALNYQSEDIKSVELKYPADRIHYSNNKIYSTLMQGDYLYEQEEYTSGTIAMIDANSFNQADYFSLDYKPFDLITDNNGYLYVSPDRINHYNSASKIKSYSLDSFELISSGPRMESNLYLHPNNTKIYAVRSGNGNGITSVYGIPIDNGKMQRPVGKANDDLKPEYRLNDKINISPDGKYVIYGSGLVYFSSNSTKFDKKNFATTIKKSKGIAFDLANNRFFLTNHEYIHIYDYQTFEIINSYRTKSKAEHIFYDSFSNELITIGKVMVNGITPKYALHIYHVN